MHAFNFPPDLIIEYNPYMVFWLIYKLPSFAVEISSSLFILIGLQRIFMQINSSVIRLLTETPDQTRHEHPVASERHRLPSDSSHRVQILRIVYKKSAKFSIYLLSSLYYCNENLKLPPGYGVL